MNGIFHKNLFSRILHSKKPYLRRWPKITPFDFEKRWDDTWILPILIGVPKFEMFAPIDDDNQYPGSSLFSRGLYPIRISRDALQKSQNAIYKNATSNASFTPRLKVPETFSLLVIYEIKCQNKSVQIFKC